MNSIIHHLLGKIHIGHLTVRDADGKEYSFGTKGQKPEGTLIVHNASFYQRIMRHGSMGLGESYMEGWWDAQDDNLHGVIGVLLVNKLEDFVPKQLRLLARLLQSSRTSNFNKSNSKKNIKYHYDIGNDFYELFLDENMGYTCGYQIHPSDTSEQLQNQKHELVSRKLGLKPGERIADLGCGWGGMLRYGAKYYGISGVGYTLSEDQYKWANAKIKEEGLSDRIRVELKDYRDASGEFDKVVSIGMAEHAWQNGYGTLLGKFDELLPVGGLGLLHTIGITDPPAAGNEPWISTYIFPGGRLPRLQELVTSATEAKFTIGHIENLKPHYAQTLRRWYEKFAKNIPKIKQLGSQYDEKFLRMWDYYLQSCEAGFRYGNIQLYQMLFCKGHQWTLPMNMEFGLPEKPLLK